MEYFFVTALICVLALASGPGAQASRSSSHEWTLFKSKYGKSYGSRAEDAGRFANFMATKQRVERHNAQGNSSFTLELNHLADWTQEERVKLNGLKFDKSIFVRAQERKRETEAYLAEILGGSSSEPVPEQFDWRQVPGRVTVVKNQGQCGSCWAFAAVGGLEGQEIGRVVNKTSQVVQLSEQELVDCSKLNNGCNGGYLSDAFEDLNSLGGIMSGKDYPYTAKDGKCAFEEKKVVMKNQGFLELLGSDETRLKKVLAKFGPVPVSMLATDNLVYYKSGVLIDETCASDNLNHAVLIVGYGTDLEHGDYWIVKNSWGPDWGDNGYFKIKRGVNMCGIATLPTLPRFSTKNESL